LLLAVEIKGGFDKVLKANSELLKEGIFSDWFLFCDNALRIAPPLIIDNQTIIGACTTIKRVLDRLN
jgi:acetylornithine/succinyldiaminopimelate/putrescine aminotransferase